MLNYQSDSDDDAAMEEESSADLGKGLQKQKEDLILNDTWGSSKRNFYGRDRERDSSSDSEDDQDEY